MTDTKADITEDNKQPINEDQDNSEEIEKAYDDMNTFKYCKTNILNDVKFASKIDKFVFEGLPLSNSQKEELLLSLYKMG